MMLLPAQPVYRGFDQAALDRAYSPSSMVANIEPLLARYAAESAAARGRHDPTRFTSHAYGAGASQTIDLFLPKASPSPLVMFIHGGYWQALSKSDASFPAPALTAAGIAYAAVDYTLAPHASLGSIVEEVRRALAFLWTERDRLGISDSGIVVAGHSAGAHLAAMLLATDWRARDLDPALVRGAILLGGIFDLEPIRLSYVNEPLGLDEAAARSFSPLFKKPVCRCPLLVAWAERDTDEFKRQSRELAAAWQPHIAALTTFEQTGVNHFDSLFDLCDPATRLFEEALRLTRGLV